MTSLERRRISLTAYLDELIVLSTVERMEAEIALNVAWSRRRYLSNGELGHCMSFETIGYTDELLEEVGLSSHRRSWFNDFFEPCTAPALLDAMDCGTRRVFGCADASPTGG